MPVKGCRSCQLGYRKTANTRRPIWCIRRPYGCCARRVRRTPTSTWTVPERAAFGVGLRRPAARKLAEMEQVSAPAITKMVSALESAGLAQREHSETDRRVVLVSATAAGRRLLEQGQPGFERSPYCLLTPQKRSCRLCARPRTLLRPGSRWPPVTALRRPPRRWPRSPRQTRAAV